MIEIYPQITQITQIFADIFKDASIEVAVQPANFWILKLPMES